MQRTDRQRRRQGNKGDLSYIVAMFKNTFAEVVLNVLESNSFGERALILNYNAMNFVLIQREKQTNLITQIKENWTYGF